MKITQEMEDRLNAAQTDEEFDAICKELGIQQPNSSVVELDPSVPPSTPLLAEEEE